MIQEPETLYKLMVLYMLDQVSFPLTNPQLSRFFLDKEYTTYFTFQKVISDLVDSGLIVDRHAGNSTRYEITDAGKETLGFFGNDISQAAVADMDEYLKVNKFRLRSEAGMTADYYKESSQNFMVHCEVREGKNVLIALDLSVPDEKSASDICANWQEKSQAIYSYAMRTLMGGSIK
ncbi:MAG: DUF4364 family protein [Eubacteriales bacterium]|nr:DUF4364 family protein [Eubacteriales bacterium]